MGRSFVAVLGAGYLILAGIASAQVAISTKSGMINYVEGRVLLDGTPVQTRVDSFPPIQNGSELRTEEGRVEVLLGPGVFMRLGDSSAVRMVSDDIMDTRLEYLAGSVIIETAEMAEGQALTFTAKGAVIELLNKGLYRLDGEPPRVSVYDGQARVVLGDQVQLLKPGRRLRLDIVAVAEKFDIKTGDAFFRWAQRRAEYLAVANVSAARYAQQSGSTGSSVWLWNPFFGMYTYLPGFGFYNSFWGCRFYAPGAVYLGYLPYRPLPGGPSKPGNPPKGPRPGRPPALPGHMGMVRPAYAGGSGHPGGTDRPAWAGGRAGGGGWSGGGGRSGGGGYSGGGHSGGSGASGSGHSGGGGYSGGGHSGGGGGGASGGSSGGGGHTGGGGGSSSGSSNAGGGRSR
jgi:hypothetical protein